MNDKQPLNDDDLKRRENVIDVRTTKELNEIQTSKISTASTYKIECLN